MGSSRMGLTAALVGLSAILACTESREETGASVPAGTEDRASGMGLEFGSGSFVFEDARGNADRPILVRYYLPNRFSPTDTPIIVVMHGNSRDGPRYFGDWVPEARDHGFFLLVPEFSEEWYPGNRWYNLGNMFDDGGNPIPDSLWTFTAVEHLVDHARELTGVESESFRIYGHSAGGQFVHRFLMFRPFSGVERAVVANAGWYTMPVDGIDFPYGLRGSGMTEPGLVPFFARAVSVLLGDQDVDTDQSNLRRTPEAMAQGSHRFERGHAFWDTVQVVSNRTGTALAWTLDTVPGAHHSNALMAPQAARLLMEKGG